MEELLVVVACLYQRGCTDAASLYYEHRPQLQQQISVLERESKKAVGPLTFDYVFPVAGLLLRSKATLNLSQHYRLEATKDSAALMYHLEF